MQEIETGLKVGYAVLLVDINNDGKPDIVVADTNRVVWYENPTWKRRTIIEGQTKPDNVCIAAYDIDGEGMSLIVAPLMGRNSTAKNNWMDGSPVRILAYRIPNDPTRGRWEPQE